ncbi:hypothetical protein HYALB_00006750 [Hymenoscyphus albidus]|uniref:NADP-dependent oxidoreductase domain-containing protein n=1 Tax=Hymenoscyphus albidus TaxID=595503 RepID=A0A9N9M353_9HELO|nr:hypothetical protein HYALB_00006750 [Hymenoscyphus albidus]
MSSKFPQRKIGDTLVSSLGLGCMGMSMARSHGPPTDEENFAVLTAAANKGINFWVTSNSYGPFEIESMFGRWLASTGRRNSIFLTTKFGIEVTNEGYKLNSKREHVRAACEASLQRLGVQSVDMYSQHRVDPDTPIEETIRAMVELKNEGKIKYLGLSECSATTLRRASKIHYMAAVEVEFSPFALEIEDAKIGLLSAARELGTKIIAYSPLGRGFMTESLRKREDLDEKDSRRFFPRFSEESFDGNLRIVEVIEGIAKEKGRSVGQLGLAWVLAQGDDFIPIPGTKHVRYLEENPEAAYLELSREEEQNIRAAIDSVGGAKGARYPEAHLSMCFGDSVEVDAK